MHRTSARLVVGLITLVTVTSAASLDASSFRVFHASSEALPWPASRVLSGRLEVVESTPNVHAFAVLEQEDDESPQAKALLKSLAADYILQVSDADGVVSYVPVSFELFDGGCPEDVAAATLVEVMQVQVRADDPSNAVLAVGFGDPNEELVEPPPEEAIYTAQPQGSTVFTALFILLNFDDEQHACSSVDGGIYGLIYNGTYNIRDNYLAFSKGRASMPMPSDFSATVAGPYTITPDSTSCNSYTSHRSAARSAAAADGYNLNDFSTVVTIPPKDTSCSWAGRATLFDCPSYSGGICNMHALRCEAFVISHECGHNLALEHSAHDSNDDEVLPSTIYQYRDHSCLMGNRNSWGVLNAVKLWKKGWIDADKVIETSDPGAFTLSSLDLPYDQPQNIPYPQMVVYKDRESPHKEYFLSFRSRLGYAYNLQSTYTGGANVHYYINSKWSYYVNTLTSSSPTHTTTHSQVTLKYGSHDETGGTVYIIPPDCEDNGADCPYRWDVGSLGACDCGTLVRTRTVVCRTGQGIGSVAADGFCVADNDFVKPATTEPCSCEGTTFEWRTTDWGDCSTTCGAGTQSRTVTCHVTGSDSTVADSNCDAGSEPDATRSCNLGSCPTASYEWRTTDWGDCSKSCGTGSQTRSVTCYNADTNQAVADSNCDAETEPSQLQTCNTQACPTTYEWRTTDWGDCSATCGAGTQTRSVTCYNADTNQAVADGNCDEGAEPSQTQSCNLGSCTGGTTYEWRYGDWNDCSASCGGGTQTRTATCVNAETDALANPSSCPPEHDSLSQPCNTQSCGGTTYEWHYGEWGDCSASCGGGTQSRTATCHNADTQQLVSSSSCASVQQDSLSRSCNTDACEEYEWRYSDWSLCSADCDGGQQTRTVTCRVVGTSTQRSASFCQYLERDSLERECNTQSCDPCTTIDCGDHGSCSEGECTCTDGYVGDHCQTAPAIGAVYVEYADDVETEQYEVDWQTSGTVSRVNLFLVEVKNDNYGLAFPIARNISNSHHHTFTIQDIFRGSGTFSVQVMSTPSISNHSASFEVDTCAYISCGSHGSCVNGACACTDGYTGATCQTAPPDPCDSYTCYHSGECSVDDENNAYCNCSQTVHSATNLPYEGERCNNIPECDIVCANGGLPPSDCSGVEPCSCSSPWAGDRCESCTFECYSGAAAASCDECVCGSNFMGTHCELQFRTFEIGPFDMDYANVDSAAERESFFALFVTDVATFLGIAESRVIARSVRRGVYVSFSLVGTEPQSWSDRRKMRFDAQSTEEDSAILEQLNEWMNEIKAAIESRHVDLFSGSVMQHLSADASVAPSSSSGSSSSSSASVGLIVGALLGSLVVVAAIVYAVRRRGGSSVATMRKRANSRRADVGMITNHYGNQPTQVLGEQQRYHSQQPQQHQQQYHQQQPQQVVSTQGEGEYYAAAAARPPPPVPGQPQLPPNWVQYVDAASGAPYYYNTVTQESVWTMPQA